MTSNETTINHVSDTALWVAHYRALESARPDALFQDPYAQTLVGERGRQIAEHMKATAKYTAWNLAIRTYMIDRMITNLISEGVDTVLNLGCGLDTRPYRMALPEKLLWIEVDYPHMIEHKETTLARETSRCRLERIAMDLADRKVRKTMLSGIAANSKKILVLTEGVIPYLTEEQVADLAEDLRAHKVFCFWITEYFAPSVYPFFRGRRRIKKMENAPFRFFPEDWFGFFKNKGWSARATEYLADESVKLHRKIPMPWWTFIFKPLENTQKYKSQLRNMGYTLFAQT